MPHPPTTAGSIPWPQAVAHRYRSAGLWRDVRLFDSVLDTAATFPDHEALVSRGRRWTYAELVVEVEALAAGLRSFLDVDDRVVIQLPNEAEYVLTTLACLAAGIVPLWAVPQHRARELTAFAEHCDARAVITVARHRGVDHEQIAHDVRSEVAAVEHVVVVGDPRLPGSMAFADLARGASQTLPLVMDGPADADAVAVLIPSGGTTGASKIVPRTHNDLDCMIRAACAASLFDHTSRYLVVLPLGHGFANTGPGILGTLVSGGTVVVCGSPAPETAIPLAVAEGATSTSVVPAILGRWVEYLETHGTRTPAMTLLQVGGARMGPSLAERAECLLEATVQQVFGMSEGLTCVTRIDDAAEVRRQTVGHPICPDDEVRVVDDDGIPVPVGTPGVLLARGPYTVRGYYRSPEADRAAFTPDGWYVTGDLVVQRTDGRLVVTGRATDTINRGGEKVSAEEVESLVHEMEQVRDCAVVAVHDAVLGAEVAMFSVAADGRTVALADVRDHLVTRGLAPFKVPRHLLEIGEIPLTGIGKIDRKALREKAAEALAAAGRVPV